MTCNCPPWVFPSGHCGITDTWDRDPTTSPDWGTADAHLEWDENATGQGEVNIADLTGRLYAGPLSGAPGDDALAEASLIDDRPAIRSDFSMTFSEWPTSGASSIIRFVDHGFSVQIQNSSIHTIRLTAGYPSLVLGAPIAFSPTPGSTVLFRHEVEVGVEQRLYVNGALLLSQGISAHTWLPTGRIVFGLNSVGGGGVPIAAVEIRVDHLDCQGIDGPIAWCVPEANQPVHDEAVGVGDGVTTQYATLFSYVLGSLQVYVGGILSEVDQTDPDTGTFTLIDAAPLGAAIRASYRAGAG